LGQLDKITPDINKAGTKLVTYQANLRQAGNQRGNNYNGERPQLPSDFSNIHLVRLAVKWKGLARVGFILARPYNAAIDITRPEPYQAPGKFPTDVVDA